MGPGDPGLVFAGVGEQGTPVDIADGIEPLPGNTNSTHRVVHLDEIARLEADAIESKTLCCGPATCGDEQFIRLDLHSCAVIEHDGSRYRPPGHGTLDSLGRRPGIDLHVHALEG